jgi:hypothetical protein
VKPFHRAPREVYRVFDEEEFLADTTQELASPSSGRRTPLFVASAFVLAVGAASLLVELLASPQRLHGKAETHRVEQAPRVASVVSILRRVHARGDLRGGSSEARRPKGASVSHRGKVTVVQVNATGGSLAVARQESPPAPADAPSSTAASESAQASPTEFGFER